MDLRERRPMPRRHPWEVVRAEFFVDLLRRTGARAAGSVLDVGAGDAYLARRLAEADEGPSSITCWDIHYESDDLLNDGAVTLMRERPTRRFEGIMFMDVLEHVENDREFLEEILEECLAPDG
nr:methyltransferase domain-containing protein [Acidimicrobiales bacterium]